MDTTIPNTQTRDQQIARTKSVDTFGPTIGLATPSSAVPSTLSGTDVFSNPTSFQVPQLSNPNSALTNAITGITTTVNTAQKEDTTAEDKSNASNDILINLSKQLGGQASDTTALEDQAGLPNLNKELNDLQTLQSQQLGGYISSLNKNEVNAEGHFGPAVSDDEAKIQRQHGIDALLTSSLIQAKEGNITAARATVDQAIASKYDPIKNAITIQNSIIQQNSANLSRADKKLADAKVEQNNLQLKKIDQQAQNEKDVQTIVQTAAQNGAPNSVLSLMSKATDPISALQYGNGYISDPLDRKLKLLQITKLNQDISNANLASKVYVKGANPSADALITSINSGKSKLSDIPDSQAALKNYVQQGLATTGGGGVSDVLQTTSDSLKELQTMVDKDQGFSDAVGFRGVLGSFTGPLAGSAAANFAGKAKQVVNDIVLPNLTLLHGLGRITDREFQALQSAVTSLSIDPKTGTSSLSEGEFKKELTKITERINDKIANTPATSNTTTLEAGKTLMIGPDGNTYSVPNENVDAFIKDGGKKQ